MCVKDGRNDLLSMDHCCLLLLLSFIVALSIYHTYKDTEAVLFPLEVGNDERRRQSQTDTRGLLSTTRVYTLDTSTPFYTQTFRTATFTFVIVGTRENHVSI